ncbi:MAG: thermonuclease family protein [Pseudomonadota bacterium]
MVIKPSFAENNSENKADSPAKAPQFTIDFDLWKNKKEIKLTKTGRVDKIIDGLTFTLKDGTVVRLASIDIPDRYERQNNLYEQAVVTILKDLFKSGTKVHLFQTRSSKEGRRNRMGHRLAHVVTDDDNIWIQGQLLQEGLAHVYNDPDQDELLAELLEAELKSMRAQNGIWDRSSPYFLRTPDQLDVSQDEFVVVQATPKKVATVRNNVYLNFGQNWKNDFTVMITPDQRKKLARNGVDPLSLANQPLRVRGWLREYNGPFIELEDIGHLQVLKPDETLQNEAQDSTLAPENEES